MIEEKNTHELGGEISMLAESNENIENYARDLTTTIRSFENEKTAIDHIINNFDIIHDNMTLVRESCKDSFERWSNVTATHLSQLDILNEYKKISNNIESYFKSKGDQSVASMKEHLRNSNAIKVTLPEPYFISDDGKIKYQDVWFLEPTGASLLSGQFNEIYAILLNISKHLNEQVSDLLKNYHNIFVPFCCKSGFIKKEDGTDFTQETLLNIPPSIVFFFLHFFTLYLRNGSYLRTKALLLGDGASL